jgi:hypothetical protein
VFAVPLAFAASLQSPGAAAGSNRKQEVFMQVSLRTVTVLGSLALGFASPARARAADDSFFDLTIGDLELDGQSLPQNDPHDPPRHAWWDTSDDRSAVVLDGAGEAYLAPLPNRWPLTSVDRGSQIVIRALGTGDVRGKLLISTGTSSGSKVIPFKAARSAARPDAKRAFYTVKLDHYKRLVDRQIPGGAWFRHQARLARLAMGETAENESLSPDVRRSARIESIADSFDYFSGGRAMSENLQLDRLLRTANAKSKDEPDTQAVADLRGITVAAIDWSKLTQGLKPRLDPLATAIPADQHAAFFATFADFVQLADDGLGANVPTLGLARPRSEDARTLARYERQLGLSLTGVGRLIGPKVVKSMALSGSDPFFRTGTDVAVLLESADPAALETLLLAQITQRALLDKDARAVSGQSGKLKYRGLRTADRSVCAYVARLTGSVVVTNSTYQLERLASVATGETPSIAGLPEYAFFRDRYPLGDGAETAFLFLSDATIRRWCSPRWRIAASRRTRDMAVMNELQATYVDELVADKVPTKPVESDLALAWPAELRLTPTGVESSIVGNLAFQTPIGEIPLARVTASEAEAYAQWREGYERNWRWAFDPIGLRIDLRPESVAADLTVMPLIAGTDYRELISVTQGAKIKPGAGDPHDALAQAILAVNLKSPQFRSLNNLAMTMAPGPAAPFAWMGETVSLYMDDGPLWGKIAAAEDTQREQFVEQNMFQLPVGLRFEVANSLKLTAFLAGVRALVDQTAPNMVEWTALTYRDRGYVKITPKGEVAADPHLKDAALYYAPSAKALLFSPVEDVIKRAIDRELPAAGQTQSPSSDEPGKTAGSDKSEQAGQRQPPAMLGENLTLRADAKIVGILAALSREQYQAAMQWLAWNNLPILNEWHRLYPQFDPVDVHERVWHVRLICPGGGKYVWKEEFQTMQSTVYGCPGDPKTGPAAPPELANFAGGNFGLSFEEQGLRARVVLERVKTASQSAKP